VKNSKHSIELYKMHEWGTQNEGKNIDSKSQTGSTAETETIIEEKKCNDEFDMRDVVNFLMKTDDEIKLKNQEIDELQKNINYYQDELRFNKFVQLCSNQTKSISNLISTDSHPHP
jgi:formyltetrahydrofolate hydrolase